MPSRDFNMLRGHLAFLADDLFEGRGTGSAVGFHLVGPGNPVEGWLHEARRARCSRLGAST